MHASETKQKSKIVVYLNINVTQYDVIISENLIKS